MIFFVIIIFRPVSMLASEIFELSQSQVVKNMDAKEGSVEGRNLDEGNIII